MLSSPPLTGETAAIIRMVEDLPAPLGPRKTEGLAAPDLDDHALDRLEVAERLAQPRARIIASVATFTGMYTP